MRCLGDFRGLPKPMLLRVGLERAPGTQKSEAQVPRLLGLVVSVLVLWGIQEPHNQTPKLPPLSLITKLHRHIPPLSCHHGVSVFRCRCHWPDASQATPQASGFECNFTSHISAQPSRGTTTTSRLLTILGFFKLLSVKPCGATLLDN